MAVMVVGICFRGDAMILLFSIITGLTLWEYTGLVNEIKGVSINRFISTAAGVYLFLAFAGYCAAIVPSAAFIPYLLTVVYLFVSELYTKNENALHDWAFTMLGQMYVALPFPSQSHRRQCGIRLAVAHEHLRVSLGERHRCLLHRLIARPPQVVPKNLTGKVVGRLHRWRLVSTSRSGPYRLV